MKEGVILNNKNIKISKLKETCDDISDNFEFLRYLMTQNLRYQLALEDYELDTGNKLELLMTIWSKLDVFRKNRENWSLEKQIQEAKIIQEDFQQVVNEIGKEHFTFYEDGDINYIWKKVKKEDINK